MGRVLVCWEWGRASKGCMGNGGVRGEAAEMRFSSVGVSDCRESGRAVCLCAVVGGDLVSRAEPCGSEKSEQGAEFPAQPPVPGPLFSEITASAKSSSLCMLGVGGRVIQNKRSFCGTVFLRIAVTEFGEVSPVACMSWVLFSEVSLCLVSGADGF